MNSGNISFIAMRGRQGENTYYLTQCSIQLALRLFIFDENEISYTLDENNSNNGITITHDAMNMTSYSNSYIVAPFVAASDNIMDFVPFKEEQPDIGVLSISLSAQLIVYNGKHIRDTIQKLISEDPSLGGDMIPIMLVPKNSLVQVYNPTQEKGNIAKHRSRSKQLQENHLTKLVLQIIEDVPLFQGRIEREKTTISNRSTALFTLSAIFQATQALLGLRKKDEISKDHRDRATLFWRIAGEVIPQWQQIIRREVTSSYLRTHYVHSHTVTLIAIGLAGRELMLERPEDWQDRLQLLGNLDWSRENTALWEGRAMIRGRMSKALDSINLTAIAIKRSLELELAAKDIELERRLLGLE